MEWLYEEGVASPDVRIFLIRIHFTHLKPHGLEETTVQGILIATVHHVHLVGLLVPLPDVAAFGALEDEPFTFAAALAGVLF